MSWLTDSWARRRASYLAFSRWNPSRQFDHEQTGTRTSISLRPWVSKSLSASAPAKPAMSSFASWWLAGWPFWAQCCSYARAAANDAAWASRQHCGCETRAVRGGRTPAMSSCDQEDLCSPDWTFSYALASSLEEQASSAHVLGSQVPRFSQRSTSSLWTPSDQGSGRHRAPPRPFDRGDDVFITKRHASQLDVGPPRS